MTRREYAEGMVGGAGSRIVLLDIQAQADDMALRACATFDFGVQRAERALAAGIWRHVDALDPPPLAVAPVAPFECGLRVLRQCSP